MYSDVTGCSSELKDITNTDSRWFSLLKSAIVYIAPLILAPMSAAFPQTPGDASAGSKNHETAAAYYLNVKPETCVALHKGQRCFTQVVLSWTVPDNQQYCLFNEADNSPLHCSTSTRVKFTIEYVSDASTAYELRRGADGKTVASATVTTAWVYRTGRRSSSSWRLF